MRGNNHERRQNLKLRISMAFILLVLGALFVSFTSADNISGKWFVLQQFGIAIMVAGAVSLLTEIMIEIRPPFGPSPDYLHASGIQMLANKRQGDDRYHTWVITRAPQDLFFAGRSVLHRIQIDFKDRHLTPVEDILVRKISEGSTIKILFCNPLWNFIPDIAAAEGQTLAKIFDDFSKTIEIVKRISDKLLGTPVKYSGEIDIRIYEELFQYAYHRTENYETTEKKMYLGLYFARRQGCHSPLFEVFDSSIQTVFEHHFDDIFAKSTQLLFYPKHGLGASFNDNYYDLFRHKITAIRLQS
jgi:hypothetical protein